MTGKDTFKQTIQKQYGFSEKESEHIYNVYIDFKVAEFDRVGRFSVKHGALMAKEPMLRALQSYNIDAKPKRNITSTKNITR